MFKVKCIILIIILIILAGFAGYKLIHSHYGSKSTSSIAIKYHCPMHPTYVSDKPGDCPICGMKLVPMENPETAKPTKKIMYKSTMNPNEVSDKPGKDSMGMDMVPFEIDEGSEISENQSKVEGLVPVTVSPEKQQLSGVQTGFVEYRDLHMIIRSAGRIAYDPDLFTAQTEYLEAVKTREKVKDSSMLDVIERSNSLINSAKLKLALMGLSEIQIKELEEKKTVSDNLLIGKKGGTIWMYAQIYEYESNQVQIGQIINVTSKSLPGKIFGGIIRSIDPVLNPDTRTLRVRAELDNTEGLLKPDMFVNAEININLGKLLSVTKEAILDTGVRQIAFVDKGNGLFEPREVKLGQETDDYYQLLSGLAEGDKIVTSANFLIDSESKLKSALSGMSDTHKH